MRILETLTADSPALTVSEIARRSGLHVATASRLVAALVGHGLLARRPDGRVAVGVRLWELGSRASPALGLREAAMPFLEDLHAVVGHHVQLGVLDGGEVLFLERLSAPGAVVNYTRIAGRLRAARLVVGPGAAGARAARAAGAGARRPAWSGSPRTPSPTPARLRAAAGRGPPHRYRACCPGTCTRRRPASPSRCATARDAVVAALSVIVPNDGTAHQRVPLLQAAARGIGRGLGTPAAGGLVSHWVRRSFRPV